jgi:hypothetical protein
VDVAHDKIFIQVFIEFILNVVRDSPLFDGFFTIFIRDWETRHDVMESNELWVLEIFFRRNQKLRDSFVMERFVS